MVEAENPDDKEKPENVNKDLEPTLKSLMESDDLSQNILKMMEVHELFRVRYVSKQFAIQVEEALRNRNHISVGIYRESYSWFRANKLYDYHIAGVKNFLKMLSLHINIERLNVYGHLFNADKLILLQYIALISQLKQLKHLKLTRFNISPEEGRLLLNMTQLVSIDIHSDLPIDIPVGDLGDNIRNISISGYLKYNWKVELIKLLSRNIPLEKLSISRSELKSHILLDIVYYLLSNFEALKVLEVIGERKLSLDDTISPEIEPVVAANLKELRLENLSWSSFDYFNEFVDNFFSQPMPKLEKMVWRENNFKLDLEFEFSHIQDLVSINCKKIREIQIDDEMFSFAYRSNILEPKTEAAESVNED